MPHYLIHPDMPPIEVVAFDKTAHTFTGRRVDGEVYHDPNFWIEIVKRCGYSITQETPEEFHHAI